MKSLFVSLVVLMAALPAFAQDSGWIGVYIADQTDRGVLVRSVEPNSPAEKGGLRANDVILEYNKQDVMGVQQLTRLVNETPVGRSVDVVVRRDNREQTVKLTTEKAPGTIRLRTNQQLDINSLRDNVLRDRGVVRIAPGQGPTILFQGSATTAGIRVESLTPQLREFFGVKDDSGVLVSNVELNSVASKAGVRAGDVVIAVAGRAVSTPADFNREYRAGGQTPTLKVIRDKQEREIRITN